jgi:tetratricopeptide (TPR) repeat protein
LQDFDKAVSLSPNKGGNYYNRGYTYGKLARFPEAIRDFDRAITLSPSLYKAYYFKGLACEKVGSKSDALTAYQSFLKIVPAKETKRIQRAKDRVAALTLELEPVKEPEKKAPLKPKKDKPKQKEPVEKHPKVAQPEDFGSPLGEEAF